MTTRREFNRLATISSIGLMIHPGLGTMYPGSEKIKIGQIGTGHSHAEKKYTTIQRFNKHFEVVGLVENDPQSLKIARNKIEFQDARWMTEEQLFNTSGLMAVLVETDFNDLLPTAIRCIENGFHVHIDKPPGDSLEGLKSLLQKAAAKNLVVQMGYMFRYHPAFQFCFNAVREGLVGEVFEVHGVISKKIKAERRKRLANTYGGGMMLLGCHLIDILVALSGRPQSISRFGKQSNPDQDNLFDNELAVFEYPRLTATITSTLLEVDGMNRRQFIVCGSNGTIQIQPLEPAVLRLTLEEDSQKYKKGMQQINLSELTGRYDDQMIDFARQVKGETTPLFSTTHDLDVHESLLKASGIIPLKKEVE